MKTGCSVKTVLRWVNHYVVIFLLVAFVITCCTMLFVSTLSKTLGLTLSEENLGAAATITFWNVVLLSVIFTVLDAVRRKWTVDRPVKRITEAAERMTKGDFSVRIQPQNQVFADEPFGRIIDCFNKMAEELDGVEMLRTDFIANVSHEMKTPLAVMKNYGTLLQAPELSEEKRLEYAKGVTEGARRMADMMTNILNLNRLENQQIYPKNERFDLGEQLCECLLAYESVWEAKAIDLSTDLAEDVSVRADTELLAHVWNNLFSNAFKFTPIGGKVSVSLTATAHHAVVTVTDSGPGMTAEVGGHIFEKFYQGDTSHATEGNGLGLPLVKRVVDILQGEIAVESKLGKGSAFTVKIRKAEDI